MVYSNLDRERRRKESIESHILSSRGEKISNPRVELVLDSMVRQLGEQGWMSDCIKSSSEGPDLRSDIDASTIVGRVEAACSR